MGADTINFTIEQGANLARTFLVYSDAAKTVKLDLTGYTARMKVKTADLTTVLLSLTQGGGLTLGGVNGTIDVAVSATDTATMAVNRSYRYDLEIVSPSGVVTRVAQGVITVSPEVTT